MATCLGTHDKIHKALYICLDIYYYIHMHTYGNPRDETHVAQAKFMFHCRAKPSALRSIFLIILRFYNHLILNRRNTH